MTVAAVLAEPGHRATDEEVGRFLALIKRYHVHLVRHRNAPGTEVEIAELVEREGLAVEPWITEHFGLPPGNVSLRDRAMLLGEPVGPRVKTVLAFVSEGTEHIRTCMHLARAERMKVVEIGRRPDPRQGDLFRGGPS